MNFTTARVDQFCIMVSGGGGGGHVMRGKALATALVSISLFSRVRCKSGGASDLVWQVENPFRFFKTTHSFAMHEAAFRAVRGNGDSAGQHRLAHRAQTQ